MISGSDGTPGWLIYSDKGNFQAKPDGSDAKRWDWDRLGDDHNPGRDDGRHQEAGGPAKKAADDAGSRRADPEAGQGVEDCAPQGHRRRSWRPAPGSRRARPHTGPVAHPAPPALAVARSWPYADNQPVRPPRTPGQAAQARHPGLKSARAVRRRRPRPASRCVHARVYGHAQEAELGAAQVARIRTPDRSRSRPTSGRGHNREHSVSAAVGAGPAGRGYKVVRGTLDAAGATAARRRSRYGVKKARRVRACRGSPDPAGWPDAHRSRLVQQIVNKVMLTQEVVGREDRHDALAIIAERRQASARGHGGVGQDADAGARGPFPPPVARVPCRSRLARRAHAAIRCSSSSPPAPREDDGPASGQRAQDAHQQGGAYKRKDDITAWPSQGLRALLVSASSSSNRSALTIATATALTGPPRRIHLDVRREREQVPVAPDQFGPVAVLEQMARSPSGD